jgi:ketosteroid isomerase-like protein
MPDARTCAKEWVAAWNAHDLDQIMAHYAADVILEAQTVVSRWKKPDGRLVGKEELRKHFALGLQLSPQLKFTIEDIFLAPSGYALLYRRENGNRAIEAVTLNNEGLATRVTVYYLGAQA